LENINEKLDFQHKDRTLLYNKINGLINKMDILINKMDSLTGKIYYQNNPLNIVNGRFIELIDLLNKVFSGTNSNNNDQQKKKNK
jgi:hypothetical protein